MRPLGLPLVLAAALLIPATSIGQGDEASKSPQDILADATRDLGAVHSYHVAGRASGTDGTARLVADVDAAGPARFQLDQKSEKLTLLLTKSAAYVRANKVFWRREGHVKDAKALKQISGRWVKVPTDSGFSDLVKQFTPTTLAHCLTTNLGTITKRPATTFGGRRVIVLADKGDKPGTSPGLLYLTSAGKILPVRARQTGRQRAGGHHEAACGGSDRTTRSTDIRFSRFDKPVKISPPSGAIDLTQGSSSPSA
jgi:hypothetical protein